MRRALAAVVAGIALAGTAHAEETAPTPVPNPILEPAQRWAFDGFSIQPPQETAWYSLAKTRTRAVLVKLERSGEDGRSFATVVAERVEADMPTPEAFVEVMRTRRAREVDARRIASVRHEETLESREAPWCTRYRVRADEVVPWYAAARVTEVIGRACLHPQVPGLVVDASYAVRVPFSDDAGGGGMETAARFLAGLQLLPVPTALNDPAEVTAAARAGDAAAAYRLGAMYERGRGVPASDAEAERWYRAAARDGEADALYNLGAMLERGAGGARDPKAAADLFRRASDQRDAQAQLNLGLLYYKGDGVARDLVQARAFLLLAALNGSARAKDLMEKLSFADARKPSPSAEVAP